MQLYKFMSLQPFERVADALLGRRVYCSKPEQLNDPLEGLLGHHAEGAEAGKPLDDQLSAALLSMSFQSRIVKVEYVDDTPLSRPRSPLSDWHSSILRGDTSRSIA